MEQGGGEGQFEIPSWAGKPPIGFHLDVNKGDKLLQKLMIDEKRAYFFGRNPEHCDFIVEHASCSRIHAVLLFHRHLQRFALLDLGSCHGTFLGKVRIESRTPVFLDMGAEFHFGASSRIYTLRARLRSIHVDETGEGSTLPGKEHELEYNTALNRRIIALPVAEEVQRKRPRGRVSFNEDETVINPEDVDPSIGRFRNMVATAVISSSSKRNRTLTETRETPKKVQRLSWSSRSDESFGGTMVNSLGIVMNAAPDISLYPATLPQPRSLLKSTDLHRPVDDQEPHKKKYAKEAWPGRKPTAGF